MGATYYFYHLATLECHDKNALHFHRTFRQKCLLSPETSRLRGLKHMSRLPTNNTFLTLKIVIIYSILPVSQVIKVASRPTDLQVNLCSTSIHNQQFCQTYKSLSSNMSCPTTNSIDSILRDQQLLPHLRSPPFTSTLDQVTRQLCCALSLMESTNFKPGWGGCNASEVFDKNAPTIPTLAARGPKLISPTPEHNSYITPKTRGHTMFRRWKNTPGSCAAVPREAVRGPNIQSFRPVGWLSSHTTSTPTIKPIHPAVLELFCSQTQTQTVVKI